MKKCGLFALLFGLAAMSIGLFSSCNIGLGAAVDTEPPSMTIENPQPSVIIRDAFQICGTFTDDGTISALKVELTDNQTQKKYGPIVGTWDEDHNWQATINPLDLHMPDGKYEATITMSDNGGHSSVSTRSFVIDNTAPVLVLSRPASDASETDSNKIESYGQYLTIEGQAADDNNIEKIVINFFDEAGVEIPAAKKEITSIPPTISLDVAKFLDNDVYSALYGNDKSLGEKRFTCTITAYDTAKRYPPKGREEADDNYGNGESSYILWTDWEKFQTEYQKATNSTSKIKVPDLYSIKSGKAATTNERSAETDSLIVNFFEKTVSRASFKLNPLNNPSYSISGLDLGVVSEVENERSLTVQLAKGLDGLSLDTDNMKVYLIPLDENGNEVSETKLYPQKSEFQQKGDGQFLTAIQKDNVKDASGNAANLVYGTKYVIGVEGTDSEGNVIVPSFDGSKFVIRFKAKSVAPRLTVDSPSEPTTYIKKGEALLFKGTTAVPDGYPTISITCKKGEEDSATVYTYKVTEADKKGIEDGYIYYNWSFTVPAAGTEGQFFFDQTKSYIYDFDIAADLENMPNNRSKTVFYDVENPTIKIDSMLPTADKYTGAEDGTKLDGAYLNGDVTMQVAISDDDAVNKEIKDPNNDKRPYFIIQDANTGDDISFRVGTETEPTKKHYITIPQKQSFVIHTEDIASTVQARKIKVKIFAQDRAGNLAVDFDDKTKTYFEREYTVDQSTDIPVILPYNSSSLTLTYSTKDELENHLAAKEYKSVLTTGSDLLLSLKDDDGIQKVLFYIGSKDAALAENATPVINQTPQGSPSATTLQYTLPTDSGRYQCKIQVEDTVGKKAEKSFWIIVTGAAPQVSISNTSPDNKIITLSSGSKTEDAKTQFVNNISIESGYNEFTVKRIEKVNGEDVETVLYGTNGTKGTILNGTSFEDTFIPAANRNENKIKYVVTDEMNHSGEREFIYYTDSVAPVIDADSIKVPDTTKTEGVSFRFEANSNDPSEGEVNAGYKQSGISKIQYVFESSAASSAPSTTVENKIKTVNGVSSLNETVIFGDEEFNYVFNTEGTKTIYIRAIDDVGNVGLWAAKSFMFDKASPVVNIASYKRDGVDENFVSLTSTNKRFQSGKEFSLKVTASDATGLSSFEIWQNDIKLNISKANVENGNWIITGLPKNAAGATVVESGVYTYKVIATDNSAFGTGESAQSAKTTTQTIEVTIDVTNPRVKIGLVSDDTLDKTDTDLESTNYGVSSISGSAPFTFTGKADDNESDENEAIRNSASLVRELFYAFSETAENPPADSEFVSYGNPSGGNWNIPMNLGTGKNDGQEIVKAEDGKTPVTLYEGQKYLWVYVYDEAGNQSLVKHVGFMVDQAAPSIIETKVHKLTGTGSNITESQTAETPKADGIVYLNKASAATGYTLRGTVSDVNGISRVTVDGTPATLATNANEDGSFNWSWTNDNQQGDYTHEVVVYDKSGKNGADGKSNSTTIHVIFDTTDPTADIEDFDDNNTAKQKWLKGTGSSIINGTAAEVGNGSGLASIYYKVDKGENDYPTEASLNGWKKLPTSTSWTDAYNPSSLSENTNTDDSSHTITVLVYDKAGNKCEKTRYFRYDKSNPTITFSGSANPGVNSKRNTGFTLTVNAKDTNEVASVKFIYGNNDVSVTTPDSGDKKDGEYSKSFNVGQNTNALADGTYDFTIRVFDIAGNYADVTRSFTIDTQKPSIETVKINNVAVTKDINPSGWYNTQAIPLTVTPRDNVGGSGVYTVEYQTLKDTESEPVESKWIPLPCPEAVYDGSAIFNGVGIDQKLYIRVKDEAGNIEYFNSNNAPVLLNIDTSVPTVGNTFYYQLEGENTATQSTGQIYVNGSKDLIIYGAAADSESGLASVSFKIGETSVTPSSIEYAITGTDAAMTSQTYMASPSNTKAIKYWKATFAKESINSKEKCGTLKVTATNGAVGADGTGASSPEATVLNITYDNTKPVPVINSFTSTNTKKQPYKKSETEYYVNNKDDGNPDTTDGTPTFTISGIASDNCGVKDVTLTIGETSITRTSTSLTEWVFANIDLSPYIETATPTVKVNVTDVAGNTDSKEVTLNFDVTGPKAKHWADSNNKDIYFRIGSGVGGKYAYGTYGKDSSMEIRGTFEEEGSGLKAVYYKLYTTTPVASDIDSFVSGTTDADGNIAIVNESKTVPYNSDSDSISVISNFHGQIQVFGNTETNKYLVLVAEDYAGNRAADTLAIYGGPNSTSKTNWNSADPGNETDDTADSVQKNYYSLNKDTTPPTVTGSITLGAYTAGTGNLVVEGTVKDEVNGVKQSGVKSVTVRIDDGDEIDATDSIDDEGNWTSTIDISSFVNKNPRSGTFTVYVTATDNAGEGNSKQISAGTITVDKEAPKFENIRFTETEGAGTGTAAITKDVYSTTDENSGTRYYVKNNATGKSFKISGLATDNFGVESVKLDVIDTTDYSPEDSTNTPLATVTKTGNDVKGTCEFTIGDWSGWTEAATAKATITVTDKAGNTKSEDLIIVFDRTAPTLDKDNFVLPTPQQTESNLFKFEGNSGSVADETSAPDKVDIAFTSAPTSGTPTAPTLAQVSGIEVSSDGTWSSTVEFSTVFQTEGEKYLWVKAYDKTGNASEWTQSDVFKYDTAAPTISFKDTDTVKNPAVNSYNKDSFTLQVETSDSYGIQSVDVIGSVEWESKPENWSTKRTDYYANEDCTTSAPETFTKGTYYLKQNIATPTTPVLNETYSKPFAKNALADGTYNFKVVVTDKSNKTNSVTRSFTVDTTAPVITEDSAKVTNPAKASYSTNWYNKNQLTISATVTDALSGMSSVQAYVDESTTNKTSLSKGANDVWSGSISCGDDGTHIIHIVATDVAGNETATPADITVKIDTKAPVAPIFLGAGPSGSVASTNDITSLLVNPTLEKNVIVYAALKDDGTTANSTGIAAVDAFKQKGKYGTSTKVTDLATIKAFTKAWAASTTDSEGNIVSTTYSEGNIVKNSDKLYMCKTAHTSDATFADTNWTELTAEEYEFWSYEIKTTDMTNGGINFTVKDAAGNTADYTLFQMTVDTRAPAVTADALSDADLEADKKQINGKITISGIASDENGLSTTEKIKLYYTTDSTFASATSPDVSKWTKIGETTPTSDNTWSFTNIDTSKLDGTNAIENETTVYFLVSVQDKAGNIGYSARDEKLTAIVDQDSDRPVIKFTNLKFDTGDTSNPAMSADHLVPHQQTDLYGSITDDDGIKSVQYIMSADSDPAEDDARWQSLSLENGSFSLNFDEEDGDAGDGDGTKKIYFKIVDTANNTFISSKADSLNLKTPKLKDNSSTAVKYGYRSSTTGYKQTVAFLKVDNHAPFAGSLQFTVKSGSNETPAESDWKSKSDISSTPFGGPNEKKTFKIRIPAWDANDVQTVTMTLPGINATNTIVFLPTTTNAGVSTSPKATWWISPEIDVSALETGNKNCTITVSDGIKTSSDEFVIAIDNTAPVISAKNPSSSQYSCGSVIAYGETNLTYWENTSTSAQPKEFMYYALSLDDSTTPAADYDHRSSAITGWKDEHGTAINDQNKPAGSNVTLSYKPYYTQIKGGSANWYVYFDDDISTEKDTHDISFKQFLINSGITTQEAIETTDQDNKFRTKVQAYLWIKAVDQVGNTTVIQHPILIDPQGDAPSVTIDYPETDGKTLGGTVTLRGTAKDEKGTNPGVDTVWVQIISAKENGYASTDETQTWSTGGLKFTDTVTNKGTSEKPSYSHSYAVTGFKPTMQDVKQWINEKDSSNRAIYSVFTKITEATPTPVTTVGTGDAWADTADGSAYYIKAKFSGSAWSLDINKNKEFDPADGKLNPVAYRVFAKDKDKNLSSYEQQFGVFDSDNPILGALYLRQYKNNEAGTEEVTASRPYEDGMWINGTWWLYGTVTDTDGISVLTVNDVSQTITGQTGTINYKLSTTNEVDKFELKIVASDGASTPHTTPKTCIINYDKKEPVLAEEISSDYKISKSVQNSNGFYTFGSQVKEDQVGGNAQSGFDFLAFWFERETTGTDAKHVVFDVMRPKSTTANGVTTNNVSEVSWDALEDPVNAKGLKWKKISATRSSTDLGKLTINSEDKNIHVGGICMISGSIYFITSVEKNTTTNKWEIGINGQPEYTSATQNVYFAIANIVNNNVESAEGNNKSKDDGTYGYYSSISNDDGDHMLESVKEQGTAWTWQANINSQNMSDGDVKLHYVAFDKAGNFKDTVVNCKVANNAPRLASVTVWSDFNANGDPDEGESETKYYQGKERKLSIGDEQIYVQRATALNPTDNVFVVSGNNKDFNDNGSAFMTVKDKTRFIPEIVGGNGDLYYSYKYGKSSAFVADAAKTTLLTAHVGEKIGKGSDHGVDEDADSEGYYKEDLNNSGYIEGRTDLWEGITGETKKYMEIPGELETDDAYTLEKLGNHSTTDPMWFEYTIYDSTLGCADWNTSTLTTTGRLSSTFRVALAIKYTDETNPVVKIRPFHWNSKSDNSVSWDSNGNAEGHIELEGDLTNGIKTTEVGTTKLGDDPKVSGKIVIDGFAYDDMKLKELHVQMSNHTELDTQKTASTYNGTWSSRNFADGWGFRAEDVYCNGNGHLVHWWLTVDTAARTNVTALEQSVVVYAVDARGGKTSVHDSTTAQTSLTVSKWGDVKKNDPNALKKYYTDFYYATKVTNSTPDTTLVYKGPESFTWKNVKNETNAVNNYYTDFYCATPATAETSDDTIVYKDTTLSYRYQMDIVPYVTEIVTHLSALSESNPSIYSRTALGKYPVYEGETIQFKGFNIGTNKAKVTITGMSETTLKSGTVNVKTVNNTITLTTGTNSGASSGNVVLKVNGIEALNNMNKNDAVGNNTDDMASTKYIHAYNRQPNGVNNNILTDDVSLDVWQFLNAAVPQNGKSSNPTMKVSPNGRIGISFSNSVLYYSAPSIRYGTTQSTANVYSQSAIAMNYGGFTYNSFCWDPYGYPYSVALSPDTADDANGAAFMQFFSRQTGKNVSNMGFNENYQKIANSSRIEATCIPINASENTWRTDIERDQSISMVATMPTPLSAPDNNNNKVTVHIAYWDNFTKQIRYRQGQVGTNASDFGFKNGSNFGGSLLDLQGINSSSATQGSRFNGAYDSISTKHSSKATAISGQHIYRVAGTSLGSDYATAYQKTTTYQGGRYLDIGTITSTATAAKPRIVICWYDSQNKNLVLSYDTPSDSDTTKENGMYTGNWQTNAGVISSRGGLYCRMAIDADDGIHIAHYDSLSGDLLYTYVPSSGGIPQPASAQTFTIDSYLSVGTYCTIDVAKESNGNGGYNIVPQIGYFVPASDETSASAKIARPVKFDSNSKPLFDGASSDLYTGNWEMSIIPTKNIPISDRINVGMYKTTVSNVKGILTAIPTGGTNRIESQAETRSSHPVSASTKVYGNGTTNPAVVYCLDDGPVELAQKK